VTSRKPTTEPAAAPAPEPPSLYYETKTSWAAGEGENDLPAHTGGRVGDEETDPSNYPDHAVGGLAGLSGGTTSN
jgi:hypothetical protein